MAEPLLWRARIALRDWLLMESPAERERRRRSEANALRSLSQRNAKFLAALRAAPPIPDVLDSSSRPQPNPEGQA